MLIDALWDWEGLPVKGREEAKGPLSKYWERDGARGIPNKGLCAYQPCSVMDFDSQKLDIRPSLNTQSKAAPLSDARALKQNGGVGI